MIEIITKNWPLILAAGAMWTIGVNHIRKSFNYVRSFVVVSYKNHGQISHAVWPQIRRSCKQVGGFNREIAAMDYTVNGRSIRVPFTLPTGTTFWYGPYGPLMVAENGGTVYGVKGVTKMDQLVCDAVQFFNENKAAGSTNFYIRQVKGTAGIVREPYPAKRGERGLTASESESPSTNSECNPKIDRSLTHTPDELDALLKTDPFSGLHYPSYIDTLLKDIDLWWATREWCEKRSIPWRMGIMLYGVGGTGKSSLNTAAAKKLGIPIYQYHLNTLTNVELLDEWASMTTPCAVAFEDFDNVFHGRVAQSDHKSLSFDTVLNVLSGINARSGVLVFVNTNDISKIDPALGQLDENGRPTRPGRISRIIHMGPTEEQQRRNIANQIVDFLDPEELEAIVAQGEGTTANQFQQMCVDRAQQEIVL